MHQSMYFKNFIDFSCNSHAYVAMYILLCYIESLAVTSFIFLRGALHVYGMQIA